MNPLLILHGALGSAAQMAPVNSVFENKGYVTYALNFSGHGGAAFQNTFGIEQFAEDVLQYMDMHQLKQVDMFGYSMGGYVALWLAINHPDRIGQIVTLGTKFDWSMESSEKEVRKLNPEKILEKVPAFAHILEDRHAPCDWKLLLRQTGEMMLNLGKKPLLTREIFQSIQHQVIICLGDQDDMADRTISEEVASLLPNGKFTLLDNTPHPIEKVDLKKFTDLLS